MFTQLKKLALLFTLTGAFTVPAQFASTASAMCVANITESNIYVKFECGPLCENVWNIEPRKLHCRPNTGGVLTSAIVGYFGPNTFAVATLNVEAHGFAAIVPGSDGRAQLCVYGRDESQNTCESYKLVGEQ